MGEQEVVFGSPLEWRGVKIMSNLVETGQPFRLGGGAQVER